MWKYCPLGGQLFWSRGYFLSVYSPRMLSAADIALSTCEVTMKPQSCSRRDCGRKVVRIAAVSDFINDGDRSTRIITEPARSQSPLWKSHDPPDAFVSNLTTLLWRERFTVLKTGLAVYLGRPHLAVNNDWKFESMSPSVPNHFIWVQSTMASQGLKNPFPSLLWSFMVNNQRFQ